MTSEQAAIKLVMHAAHLRGPGADQTSIDMAEAADMGAAALRAMEWKPISEAPISRPVIVSGYCNLAGVRERYQEVCKWFESKKGDVSCWPIIFMHGYEHPTHYKELGPMPDDALAAPPKEPRS